jgi:hypothetical protein
MKPILVILSLSAWLVALTFEAVAIAFARFSNHIDHRYLNYVEKPKIEFFETVHFKKDWPDYVSTKPSN